MSHFSKIKAEINDTEALEQATRKMGLKLVLGGECRYYGERTKKADIVIQLPGKYDVALNQEGNLFSMEADLYNGEVEKYVGPNAERLMQQYSAEKVRMEAFKRSLGVTESVKDKDIIMNLMDSDTGGQIQIICHLGGKVDVKTQGFPGKSCMKFQDLESALGSREEFSPTLEMYETEPIQSTEFVNNANN